MTTAAQQFATEGFGPENLPFGSFTRPDSDRARLGARLGERVLDLATLADLGTTTTLTAEASDALHAPNLDALLAAGRRVWDEVRNWLQAAVTAEGDADAVVRTSVPLGELTLRLPFTVADYVDGYASEHHASNVGHIFRPNQPPLLPNWKHLPVGYHGRAGTVVVSGTPVPRPKGLRPEPDGTPSFGPSRRLDFEAELAFVLGGSAPHGEVSVADAADHLFGAVVLNDWSARDIQAYEYVPLGPYLGKSFASSISPWVVPFAALDAARVPVPKRDVPLADYLDDSAEPWGLDISVETSIDGHTISRSPARTLYWTAPQFVAHMTVNGAGLRPGDLIGTGTISGPEKGQRGSLLELSWGGAEPIELGGGRTMTFLEDGQTVSMAATAPGPGGATISFGEVTGRIEAAR
ncbi:fumarylacetoacetase [Sinomonas flava]|uniref:fumarylacetoacetase n=1 Tax=Sinomonas flava TaxID=496857 RepID=UPI0039A54338